MGAQSFSSLNTYHTCPKQYQHLYVLKDVTSKQTEATLWGTRVHKEIEDYLRDGTPMTLDAALRALPYIAALDKHGPSQRLIEHQWGIDAHLLPTCFSANDAVLRGVMDYAVLYGEDKAVIADWKTGKRKDYDTTGPERHRTQLGLFALAAFSHFPLVSHVRTMFVWLKDGAGAPTVADYYREQDKDALWMHWRSEIGKVEASREADIFRYNPSGLCRGWCPVTDCPHFVEAKR